MNENFTQLEVRRFKPGSKNKITYPTGVNRELRRYYERKAREEAEKWAQSRGDSWPAIIATMPATTSAPRPAMTVADEGTRVSPGAP